MAETKQLNERDLLLKSQISNDLFDLPAPVGGEIVLLGSKEYVIGDNLNIGTTPIRMSDKTKLRSLSGEIVNIAFTGVGAGILGTNVSCELENISIDGAQKGYEFTGVGTEVISIKNCKFTNCTTVGSVAGCYFFDYAGTTHVGNTTGITVTSTAFVYINGTKWFNTNTGTFINIPSGTFESIKLIDNNLDVPLGSTGINIAENTIVHNQEISLLSNFLVGASLTYITGFNPLDGSVISYANVGVENVTTFPQVTTAEMFSIVNPKVSMTLFNSDINNMVYWDITVWKTFDGVEVYNTVFSEDFNSGSFATNGWITVDGGENDWVVGSVDPFVNTNSAYISNDPLIPVPPNVYSSIGGALDVSHVYIDIPLPLGAIEIVLDITWKCEAEAGFDFGNVFDAPTTIIPVANTEVSAIYQIGGAEFNNQLNFATQRIILPIIESGVTRRFILSYRSDSSVENQPPFNVGKFEILSK